jgi:hypothetical protein
VIFRIALVVAAFVVALVPLPASWVEALYSERAYLALQRVLTPATNRVPFAALDLLLALVILWLIGLIVGFVRGWRKPGVIRSSGRLLARLAMTAAVVYLAFVVLWGLNYRRVPLTSRLAYSKEAVTPAATLALARTAAGRANQLRAAGFEPPSWEALPALLGESFARVQRHLAPVVPAAPGVPKWTILGPWFERSGVDGMTDPFLLETLVNTSVLPVERPFLVAHEWAHLAGYADESEASFVGWVVCLQGPPAAEYSAHLALLWQTVPVLSAAERETVTRALSPGVRGDLKAIADRVARARPVFRRLSAQVYDRYLKANRVEKGIRSYDAALELMLGASFGKGWVPALRDGAGRHP